MNWKQAAFALRDWSVALRREFHAYAEPGLCEYYTAARIIGILKQLGWEVCFGPSVFDRSKAYLIPSAEESALWRTRAQEEGISPELLARMEDCTGVVATLRGTGEGATVAFRFDIDATPVRESDAPDHFPAANGFASRFDGYMHACAHDGHITAGLTLARLLSEHRDAFGGTVKLIFQPAEEGVRGGAAMVAAGVVEDADVFLSGHIGLGARENGLLIASIGEFLAATKQNATFRGRSSHAGQSPEEGNHAILAAAQATLALHSISRHGQGSSRINVGVVQGGTARNVIPELARIEYETRGLTTAINTYMQTEAERMVRAAGAMYGVETEITTVGASGSFTPDPEFGARVAQIARESGLYERVLDYGPMNASEDCTAFLERVQSKGGRSLFMMFGAHLAAPHHNGRFDFDESVLPVTAALLATLTEIFSKEEAR